MGGVVDAIKDVVDTTIELLNDTYDSIEDGVKKGIETIEAVGKTAIDTVKASTQVIYDTVIKGESFSGSVAKQIQELGKDLGDIYDSFLDDTLGIDDGKFLGIKGGVFSKLGMLTKDFTHDHGTETIGIAIIVAMIVVSIIFPPAYGVAGAAALAVFEVGITSTIALMTVYYAAYGAITLGLSIVISGIIDGSILALLGNMPMDMSGNTLTDLIFSYEKNQEFLRIAGLAATLDGTIYDRLAGGWMYDSQFAGSVYYDATTPANLNISVGGELSLTSHAINTQFGYQDITMKNLPGDDNFSVLKLA
ncbi:MAG: hypothetical protein RBT59_13290 [Arcobacteraceae bacterium]|jgi:hypothetical protein|nr:hypothetical protein [Arcobacteraceae bacterium]